MIRSTDKIVVTGISSFIGVHLARFFAEKAGRVVGTISRHIDDYQGIRLQRIQAARDKDVDIQSLDLAETESMVTFIQTEKPDLWIHHAGWAAGYGDMDYDMQKGYAVNVASLGTFYPTLKACGCRGIIITGTSMEYSESDNACTEDDVCWPSTPYGLSKLMETCRARQLSEQYRMRTRVARIFIPFGPMDAPRKLIPSVAHALKTGVKIDLSPCLQKRDFIHVNDMLTGYEALIDDLDRDLDFDLFNLCSGEATELRAFLGMFVSILEADPRLLLFGARSMRPGEAPVSYGSNKKAKTLLKWTPSPLKDSILAYLQDEGRRV